MKKSASGTEKKNSKSEKILAKPFLKWAGGKGQLLEKFRELYPAELKENKIHNFYEPFLGSGAVFFDVIRNYKVNSAYLYDINEELILTYRVIQNDVERLIQLLEEHEKAYHGLNKNKKAVYYYSQSDLYNKSRGKYKKQKITKAEIECAARFIFLNKTCFNGLFRVNSKGNFNTPIGDYKNPKICDAVNLFLVNKALQIAEIKHADYQQIESDLKAKSFIYLDPPYRPISKTASFKSYSKNDFTDTHQIELARTLKKLNVRKVKIMLSNSDPKNHDITDEFFDELYKDYNIHRIPAKRIINSNAQKRGVINEIVVTNY